MNDAGRGRWTVERVRLDPRGRDRARIWFGVGAPLYWFCSPCGQIQGYTRARRRTHAKRLIADRVAFLGHPIEFED